ncbi:MAG: hypothetical protein ACKOXB_08035 [Flavobacteriales bacterium]
MKLKSNKYQIRHCAVLRSNLILLAFILFSSFNVSSYYDQSADEFFASGVADKILTVADTDPELLNATVFHAINKMRQQKGKEALLHSPEMQKLAASYMGKVENRNFASADVIRKKFLKNILKDAKENGFKGTLLDLNVLQSQAVDYNGKTFFYNKKDQSTELHLFYGERPTKQDKKQDREAIPNYTYKSFAENLVTALLKLDKENKTTSKAYKYSACVLQWDYSSLYKKKIPQIKLIQVVGGFQTDLIQE